MASKATLAERAATLRAERLASFKTPVFPADQERPTPIQAGLSITNGNTRQQDFETGKSYWAIHAVAQRLRQCGIIGNYDRRTGKKLDAWSVDTETRTVHIITDIDADPLAFWEREQQTYMIGYIVASLAVDSPRAFEGISVEIDAVTAEVRLVEATK